MPLNLPDFETLKHYLEPVFYLTDPERRVFVGYLLVSLVLAIVILSRQSAPFLPTVKQIFNPRLWRHPSVLLDIKLISVNHLFWIFMLAPFFGSQIATAIATKRVLVDLFGRGDFLTWSTLHVSLLYTAVLFVADDFARFFTHLCYHKIPLLWRFHAVHHSATILTPLTLYRVHIVEVILNAMRSIFVAGVIGGIFIWLFTGKIAPLEILGVSIFSLMFNLAGANLRHSPIWLGYGKVEKWVLSPAQHQIHHSANPAHFDKNFGVMIALWDRIFGTWVASEQTQVNAFGLSENAEVKQTLRHHLTGL
ncbi:Uncharacterised protein [BD1-7 clade bacterium]|uniref:Fatty acid hydroxylase domain-containing protein n=1 Tax=BD1-7 clade bacterium TaxID=2029982 RepID=A0A5S9PSP1_9GAMM|nr:Uncharacterised protein [BD1-7 clade bacterium]